jgi:hypothetical protein
MIGQATMSRRRRVGEARRRGGRAGELTDVKGGLRRGKRGVSILTGK